MIYLSRHVRKTNKSAWRALLLKGRCHLNRTGILMYIRFDINLDKNYDMVSSLLMDWTLYWTFCRCYIHFWSNFCTLNPHTHTYIQTFTQTFYEFFLNFFPEHFHSVNTCISFKTETTRWFIRDEQTTQCIDVFVEVVIESNIHQNFSPEVYIHTKYVLLSINDVSHTHWLALYIHGCYRILSFARINCTTTHSDPNECVAAFSTLWSVEQNRRVSHSLDSCACIHNTSNMG